MIAPASPPPHGPADETRKRTRLPAGDYARAGSYFVTFCTAKRRRVLGDVIAKRFVASALGACVERIGCALPTIFPDVEILILQPMPDHVHAIVRIVRDGTSLSTIIRRWKSEVTQAAREASLHVGDLWQRGFYDRILRDAREVAEAMDYIRSNPQAWWHDLQRRRSERGRGSGDG